MRFLVSEVALKGPREGAPLYGRGNPVDYVRVVTGVSGVRVKGAPRARERVLGRGVGWGGVLGACAMSGRMCEVWDLEINDRGEDRMCFGSRELRAATRAPVQG